MWDWCQRQALSTVPVVDFRRIWLLEKDFFLLIFGGNLRPMLWNKCCSTVLLLIFVCLLGYI